MAKTKGALFALSASGTFAGAIIHTSGTGSSGSRAETTRASPSLKFRKPLPVPAPTSAQSAARARLTAATAYAKAPPLEDLATITGIARKWMLPPYHAASMLYFSRNQPTTGISWDAGATTWDSGASTWPT